MGFAVDLSHLTKQPIRYIGIFVLSVWDNILSWDNTQDLRIIQSKGKTELCSVRLGLDIEIKTPVGPTIQNIIFNTSASSYLAR